MTGGCLLSWMVLLRNLRSEDVESNCRGGVVVKANVRASVGCVCMCWSKDLSSSKKQPTVNRTGG